MSKLSASLFVGALAVLVGVSACQKAVEFTKFKSDTEVPRISVADARKEVDAGNAVIVDARAEPSYKAEHIAGAINIPFGFQDTKIDQLPKGKKLIIYCS